MTKATSGLVFLNTTCTLSTEGLVTTVTEPS